MMLRRGEGKGRERNERRREMGIGGFFVVRIAFFQVFSF